MSRLALAAIALPLAGFAVGLAVAAGEPAKPEKKPPTVKQLMEKAHAGTEKRPAALAVVRKQVTLDEPDWEALAANTVPLKRLADAIKDTEFGYRAPGSSYAKPVDALMAATKKKDVAAARVAVAALNKSCAGCHYGR